MKKHKQDSSANSNRQFRVIIILILVVVAGLIFWQMQEKDGAEKTNQNENAKNQEPKSVSNLQAPDFVPTFPSTKLIASDYDLKPSPGEKNKVINQFQKLKKGIQKSIAEKTNGDKTYKVSFVLQDFRTEQNLFFNEKIEYPTGSLIKIAILMATLKKIENEPKLKNAILKYEESKLGPLKHWNTPIFHPNPIRKLIDGNNYSFDQLFYKMISLSGNQSAQLLYVFVNNEFKMFYQQLGIPEPDMEHPIRSPDVYSRYMDILFHAKFVNEESSRRALGFMSMSDFNIGLQAGLPEGTLIAHKFGVFQNETNTLHWLHECGIIYTDRPYSLCVFTEGAEFTVLRDLLQMLSKLVFESYKY